MKMSKKTNLMVMLALVVLLCQVGLNCARPNGTRGNRRNSNKTRGNKGKRNWAETSPSSNVEIEPPKIEVFPVAVSETDANDVGLKVQEPNPRAAPNKWLELDRVHSEVINANLNSDLALECVAVGSPPPRIQWLKNGKPIENIAPFDSAQMSNHVFGWPLFKTQSPMDFAMANVKSKLPLRCLRPEDQGEYTCVAENNGRLLEAVSTVIIDVDTFPTELRPECMLSYTKKGKQSQPAFIMSYEYLHMETMGSDVILNCHVVGRPRPQVTWLDSEGNRINNGKKFRVTDSGNLVIKNLSWKEMGEYTCQAINEFGSDSGSTFLYPLLSEPTST